jgi:hypothetical protein
MTTSSLATSLRALLRSRSLAAAAVLAAAVLAAPAPAFAEEEEPAPAPEEPAPEEPAPEESAPAPEAPAPDAGAAGGERVAAPVGPRRWMLGLSHGPLRVVNDGGQTYHYALLTVTNDTKIARPWKPYIQAATDSGRTHVACGCSGAFERIKRRERKPSLLSVEASHGTIAPGESKELVAIFGPIDTSWSRLVLNVQGLVNTSVWHQVAKYGQDAEGKDQFVIHDAAYEERNAKLMAALQKAAKESGGDVPAPTKEWKEFLERRAWAIEWKRMGDEFRPETDPIELVREGWRVLSEPTVLKTVVPKYGGGS